MTLIKDIYKAYITSKVVSITDIFVTEKVKTVTLMFDYFVDDTGLSNLEEKSDDVKNLMKVSNYGFYKLDDKGEEVKQLMEVFNKDLFNIITQACIETKLEVKRGEKLNLKTLNQFFKVFRKMIKEKFNDECEIGVDNINFRRFMVYFTTAPVEVLVNY